MQAKRCTSSASKTPPGHCSSLVTTVSNTFSCKSLVSTVDCPVADFSTKGINQNKLRLTTLDSQRKPLETIGGAGTKPHVSTQPQTTGTEKNPLLQERNYWFCATFTYFSIILVFLFLIKSLKNIPESLKVTPPPKKKKTAQSLQKVSLPRTEISLTTISPVGSFLKGCKWSAVGKTGFKIISAHLWTVLYFCWIF